MRPTVYLFDIDGTLISTGGAGRRSMEAAFVALYGPSGRGAVDFSFAGMTDRAIVRTALTTIEGHAPDAVAIDRVLDAYLGRLAHEVGASSSYRVLPGVVSVVEWLAAHGRIAIGLGTGNIKKGAYTKLARGALDGRFAFGGFGCDAEDRTDLLRTGAARGAEVLGLPPEGCRVIVIGDTPKDVTAALGIGAECVGVGTGGFAPSHLLELGATCAFDTLDQDGIRDALAPHAHR